MLRGKTCSNFLKFPGLVVVSFYVITLVSLSAGDKTPQLRKQILSRYNKSVSPGFENSPSDVGVLLSRPSVAKFDEPTGTMTIQAYLHINWFDARLRWADDPTYQNVSWISANINDVWKPNMNIFNSGRSHKYSNTDMPLFVNKHGMIWRTLIGELNFACVQEDLRWYPLDTHTCKLSVGSLYPQDMISRTFLNFNKTVHGVDYRRLGTESPHWDQLSLDHSTGFTSVTLVIVYMTDDFKIQVRRKGWTVLAAILPLMTFLVFLSWASFALPPQGGLLSKRLAVSTTSLFLSSVFLLVLIKTVPGVGTRPPVIVKVFASVVFLEFFTCIHNVLMANILQKSSTHLGVLRKLPKPVLVIIGLHDKSEASGGRKGLLENEESAQDAGMEQFQMESRADDSSSLVATAYDRVHIFLQVIILIFVVAFLCHA